MSPNAPDQGDQLVPFSPLEEAGGVPAPGGDSETEPGNGRVGLQQVTDGRRDRSQGRSGHGPVRRAQDGVLARDGGTRRGSPPCGVCDVEVPEGQAMKCPWCECSGHAVCFGMFVWNG